MDRFIESIRVSDGVPFNLERHLLRVDYTLASHGCLTSERQSVINEIESIAIELSKGVSQLSKLRIEYSKIVRDVSCTPYIKREIKSLRVVEGGDISYRFKYADRTNIDSLYDKRGDCDDIIITRHGVVTDASYANIVFSHGNMYYTPAEPLLRGTMMAYLIDKGIVIPKRILAKDLHDYERLFLINAMNELADSHKGLSIYDSIKY